MMFVSTTTISLSHSVATFGNSSLDVFRCWDESAAQLHRFGSFRRAHFADGHAFADKVGDRVLKFSMFVYSANLDFAHQLVRQIERRFHFARFPESWFSVNRVLLAKVSPAPHHLSIMSTSEIFLIAMTIIFTVPYLVWRLIRT